MPIANEITEAICCVHEFLDECVSQEAVYCKCGDESGVTILVTPGRYQRLAVPTDEFTTEEVVMQQFVIRWDTAAGAGTFREFVQGCPECNDKIEWCDQVYRVGSPFGDVVFENQENLTKKSVVISAILCEDSTDGGTE